MKNSEESAKFVIKLIEEKLDNRSSYTYSIDFKEYSNDNLIKILFILFTKHYRYCDEFMLYLHHTLLRFNIQDWLKLLNNLGSVAKHHPLGVISFLDYFYLFLKLDFISEYAEMRDVDLELQYDILNDYFKRPGKLIFSNIKTNYENKLEIFSITQYDLNLLKNRLIKGGVKSAELIKEEDHTIIRDSITFISVQGVPPASWKWANTYF